MVRHPLKKKKLPALGSNSRRKNKGSDVPQKIQMLTKFATQQRPRTQNRVKFWALYGFVCTPAHFVRFAWLLKKNKWFFWTHAPQKLIGFHKKSSWYKYQGPSSVKLFIFPWLFLRPALFQLFCLGKYFLLPKKKMGFPAGSIPKKKEERGFQVGLVKKTVCCFPPLHPFAKYLKKKLCS